MCPRRLPGPRLETGAFANLRRLQISPCYESKKVASIHGRTDPPAHFLFMVRCVQSWGNSDRAYSKGYCTMCRLQVDAPLLTWLCFSTSVRKARRRTYDGQSSGERSTTPVVPGSEDRRGYKASFNAPTSSGQTRFPADTLKLLLILLKS